MELPVLESELQRALNEKEVLTNRKREIEVEEEENNREIIALENLVSIVKRRKGVPTVEPKPSHVDTRAPFLLRGEAVLNKTEYVKSLVYATPGVRPPEVKKLALKQGVSCPPGFPYGILGRLKEKGVITEIDGAYYPQKKNSMNGDHV